MIQEAIDGRRMTMNINLDNRVLNMNERKQLLHLKNETCSEFTRVETTQASDELRGNMSSAGSKSMLRKQAMTMHDSKRSLGLETDAL